MNKLMSYLLPGVFLIAVFAIVKTFFLPPAVTVQEWFVYLTVAVTVLCVVNKRCLACQ